MADVNGKPFLSYVLDYISDFGYKKVVLSVGYLHEKIEEYFGNRYKSISIDYAVENEPLGTGGAISFALEKCSAENVLILNGDTLFKANLTDFERFHNENDANLSIILRNVPDTSRYGSVKIDNNGRIVAFEEKNTAQGCGTINGGIYMISKELFNDYNFPKKFSFEKDLMEKYYKQEEFYGISSDGYFIDIGIPEDYARAQLEL